MKLYYAIFLNYLVLLSVHSIGAQIERLNKDLIRAALKGKVHELRDLLALGADATYAEPRFKETALMAASAQNHVDSVRLLLEAGAPADARYAHSYGMTALHLAAKNGHVAVVTALLSAHADWGVTDYLNRTALEVALHYNHLAVAREMVSRGVYVTERQKAQLRSPEPWSHQTRDGGQIIGDLYGCLVTWEDHIMGLLQDRGIPRAIISTLILNQTPSERKCRAIWLLLRTMVPDACAYNIVYDFCGGMQKQIPDLPVPLLIRN